MQQPILVTADPNDLIRITIAGDLLDADIPFFKTGLQIGKAVIQTIFQKTGKKVKIILDVSKFTGNYTAEAVQMITKFAVDNREYVEATASFGGSDKVRAAGEIVTALSGRENIKIFATEKEALVWLGL